MKPFSDVRHDLLERSPLVAGGDLVLGYGKFAEKVEFQLKLCVSRHGHNDHITLAVFGYEDGFIQFVGEIGYLVRFVAQVGNGFYHRHRASSLLLNIISFK
jgi:hypothetical protein